MAALQAVIALVMLVVASIPALTSFVRPQAQVDSNMMAELQAVKAAVSPTDTLLVVDAMTGQEAAGVAKSFADQARCSFVSGVVQSLVAQLTVPYGMSPCGRRSYAG
jgi:hypothetical protein